MKMVVKSEYKHSVSISRASSWWRGRNVWVHIWKIDFCQCINYLQVSNRSSFADSRTTESWSISSRLESEEHCLNSFPFKGSGTMKAIFQLSILKILCSQIRELCQQNAVDYFSNMKRNTDIRRFWGENTFFAMPQTYSAQTTTQPR
jgi:hypothetical protein